MVRAAARWGYSHSCTCSGRLEWCKTLLPAGDLILISGVWGLQAEDCGWGWVIVVVGDIWNGWEASPLYTWLERVIPLQVVIINYLLISSFAANRVPTYPKPSSPNWPSYRRMPSTLGVCNCIIRHIWASTALNLDVGLHQFGSGSPELAMLCWSVPKGDSAGSPSSGLGYVLVGMKRIFGFFWYSGNWFRFFQSDSPLTVFFENGIGFRFFLSESTWCFTDRFIRLPVCVENYRIWVLEFLGIVSRIFLESWLRFFSEFSSM
jgi:hypothetical protein